MDSSLFVLYKSELVSCKVKDGGGDLDEQVEVILKGIILSVPSRALFFFRVWTGRKAS